MNKNFFKLIENDLDLDSKKKFVTIIGSSPSKGARSPILWNDLYEKINSPIRMYPIDCNNDNFSDVVNYLIKNKNFIGSSITTPFKELITSNKSIYLNQEIKKILSSNCIYKKNNKYYATNTDGEAAIISLRKKTSLINKNILILGTGATAKSIIAYINRHTPIKKYVTVLGRSDEKLLNFKNLFDCKIMKFNQKDIILNEFEIIINCTVLGWGNNKNLSPLSNEEIFSLNKSSFIFDIIYDPQETKLIQLSKKHGLKTLNGLDMNLTQAALAFCYVNNISLGDLDKVLNLMNT